METILKLSGGNFDDISGVLGVIFGIFQAMLDEFDLGNRKGAGLMKVLGSSSRPLWWFEGSVSGLGSHLGGSWCPS